MTRSWVLGSLAMFLVAGVGCGGSSAAPPGKDLSAFVGTWALASPNQGTTTVTCDGQPDSAVYPGTVTWAPGTSSDLVQMAAGWTTYLGCDVSANVSGSTLSQASTETCVALIEGHLECPAETALRFAGTQVCVSSGTTSPVSLTSMITAYSFVVAPDGLTAMESASGDVLIDDPNGLSGQGITCSWTSTAGPHTKQ